MNHTISSQTTQRVSTVIIGDLSSNLQSLLSQKKVVIVTDANVYRHNNEIIDAYPNIIITSSEENKTLESISFIISKLIDMEADRNILLLGFGGGIVTDITGFAASIYMRGVSFGFIPTTLLSQVDASVGGKNGVNFNNYKNMVGVFNQPNFVICDTNLLDTLNDREFAGGMAEIIKAALICDKEMFEELEKNDIQSVRSNKTLLKKIVSRSISIKAGIVEMDLEENNERKKLNLGHTFAHAIEKQTKVFSHGEAVAIGIVIAAGISHKKEMLSANDLQRIKTVLERYDLPITHQTDTLKLLESIRHDKKRDDKRISFILNRGIGDCEVQKMSFEEVAENIL